MLICVCVKAVPATTEVRMDPATNTIVRDGVESVVNPFDTAGLELALTIKDARACAGLPTEIVLLSMGVPATEHLLRDCISRGADRGILLSDRAFAGADTLATSYALTRGIAMLPAMPDLVICGKMAVDGDTAQIGPELASALDVPCITDVRALIACDGTCVQARCGTDQGVATVEVPLPAVITVAKDAAQLRMPSIAGVRRGEAATVEVLGAAAVGADPARIGLAGSPTQVVRSFVPERQQQAERIEGSAAVQAATLIAHLEEMGL